MAKVIYHKGTHTFFWLEDDVIIIDESFICPLCDGLIPNNDMPGAYPGALSRRDNVTEICSDCGQREAFEDAGWMPKED